MVEPDRRITDVTVRPARPDDAVLLAWAANTAGEGLPLYFWTGIAGPEGDPWAIGRERALRADGSFSYTNAWVADLSGRAAGALVGYAQPDTPEPIPEDMPDLVRPLQELENAAPGSWYVNILAVDPACRRRGVARRLVSQAQACAHQAGRDTLSLIVADTNSPARTLYARLGFREVDRRPMVKDGWQGEGRAWLLLTCPLQALRP